MSIREKRRLWVCDSEQLVEGDYRKVEIMYAGIPATALVFRFRGHCLAYRNLCVHMPKGLDCEQDMIFDAGGQRLRCSMHGIVYDPVTGASLSTMCEGETLTAIRLREDAGGIWLVDKRVAAPAPSA